MVNTDTLGPLPPNWEIAYSEMGEKYYIDHNSGSTQWEDPREQLPEGWERVHDEKYGVFYVDHVNKRTQYEPPIAATSSHQYSSIAPPDAYTPHVVKASTSSSAYGSYVHANGRIPNTVASSSNGWQPTATQTVQNGYSHQYIGGPTKIQPTPLTNGGTSIVHRAPPNSVGEASKMAAEKNRSSTSYVFTRDPAQLRGELITTRIEKGPKGLGFTLIGNDAGSTRPEFIQIKTIINNGPAALDNVLHTGDVLVYVNNILMLGATQDDACQVFRQIKVGEIVTIQVCRGYPLLLDPTKMIITENVYAPPSSQQRPFGDPTATHFHQRNKEILEIQIRKGSKGFGFTITDSLQGQRVKTVRYPEQCQNLLEGDVILEVDGRNVRNIPHAELVQLLHDCPVGFQTRMLVSRNSPRHRSRTPTAAFRFGEQRATPVPVLAPRSKTPAPGPTRPTKTGSVRQYQPRNTTMPRSTHQREDLYENVSKIRSSSTTLGFSSTPNYVPISAFAYDKPSGHQLITVNLIRKPDGFGFRLVGGEEMGTPLTVGAIIEGGAAHVDGRLREHDEIVEIDGRNAEHGKHTEAVELIKKAAHIGHVKLVVRRLRDDIPRSTSMPFSAYNYGDLATSLPPTHQTNGGYNPKTPFDVHLAKLEHEDFGCTIVSLNNRYIGKIIPDSPADRCGRLKPGDCVIAINGLPLDDMSHQQVINYIKSSGNTITFTIDHSKAHPSFVSDTNGHAGLPNGRTTPSQLYSYPPASTSSIPRYDTVPSSRSNDHLYHNGFGPENGNNETLIHFELPRGAKGFGFSIRGGWEFGQMPLLVLRVAEDGPAAAAGIQVGDQIFEINGENTDGMTHDRAIQLIKEHPTVRLVIRRPQN
uniref:Uncharacterized protein n=1 Tax=Acrobeloides nanus TaxID=290746 RepID=A0A914BVU6_9BILA